MKLIRFTILAVLMLAFSVVVSGCIKKTWSNVNDQDREVSQFLDQSGNNFEDIFYLLIGDENPDEFMFKVGKSEGVFSVGSVNSINGGGSVWIAKKVGDTWNIIWQGQEYPSCQILKDNTVPGNIYSGKCFDNNGIPTSYY